jgi:hypothetical protein
MTPEDCALDRSIASVESLVRVAASACCQAKTCASEDVRGHSVDECPVEVEDECGHLGSTHARAGSPPVPADTHPNGTWAPQPLPLPGQSVLGRTRGRGEHRIASVQSSRAVAGPRTIASILHRAVLAALEPTAAEACECCGDCCQRNEKTQSSSLVEHESRPFALEIVRVLYRWSDSPPSSPDRGTLML